MVVEPANSRSFFLLLAFGDVQVRDSSKDRSQVFADTTHWLGIVVSQFKGAPCLAKAIYEL